MPVDFSLTDIEEVTAIRRADGFRLRATLRAATVVDGDRFDHWTIVGDVVEDLPDCNRDSVERGRLRLLRAARNELARLRDEHLRRTGTTRARCRSRNLWRRPPPEIATCRRGAYLGAMTLPDAKWLDFLKAGLPTFIGLAAFAAAALYLNRIGQLPMELPAVAALIIAVVGLLSGCLAVGLLLGAGYRAVAWFVKPRYEAHLYKKLAAKKKREFIAYIPHLNDRERMIFAHLLHHNQRTFENTPDCGYASVLYSLGYVQMLGGSRQVDYFAVPFGIPDPVWDALQERKAEFPYRLANASRGRTSEISPWRTPRV